MPIRLKLNDPRLPPELRTAPRKRQKRPKADPAALRGPFVERLEVTLPAAPSVNHYWAMANGRRVVSKEGRKFKKMVAAACYGRGCLIGNLRIEIMLCGSKMDVDNALKPTLDALQAAGVFENDRQVADLRIFRPLSTAAPLPPSMRVVIRTIGEEMMNCLCIRCAPKGTQHHNGPCRAGKVPLPDTITLRGDGGQSGVR